MTALDPSKLVFIDESGFDTKMTRCCGRAARGAPCVGIVPHGHWRNNTFIAGLRCDRINAPMLIEGAMDGDAFCAWSNGCWRRPSRQATSFVGETIPRIVSCASSLCDNLSVHKNAQARAAIEARGAELRLLPAYSPDLLRGSARSGLNWSTGQISSALHPDRDGLRQDQDPRAQRRGPMRRHPRCRHRIRLDRHSSEGMRPLSPKRRICANLIASYSSGCFGGGRTRRGLRAWTDFQHACRFDAAFEHALEKRIGAPVLL